MSSQTHSATLKAKVNPEVPDVPTIELRCTCGFVGNLRSLPGLDDVLHAWQLHLDEQKAEGAELWAWINRQLHGGARERVVGPLEVTKETYRDA
jgi:hypothetical protein